MNLDREYLTTRQDVIAGAIADGILCYVNDVREAADAGMAAPADAEGTP
ncbi:MAG: hypothetical protein R3C44_00805 [Chloroflexota bacterium]